MGFDSVGYNELARAAALASHRTQKRSSCS